MIMSRLEAGGPEEHEFMIDSVEGGFAIRQRRHRWWRCLDLWRA
jgi:hypothetical protein